MILIKCAVLPRFQQTVTLSRIMTFSPFSAVLLLFVIINATITLLYRLLKNALLHGMVFDVSM